MANALKIEGNVSLVLVSSSEIQNINKRFLNKDRPTNVISFKYDSPELFGEIILSTDVALSEAEKFGHSQKEHIAYLILHGLLHLAGYHHEFKGKRATQARKLQEELFKSIVVPFVQKNPIF